MEKTESIGFDFDDVICEGLYLKSLNNYFGTTYRKDDFTSYFIEEQIGKTEAELKGLYDYMLQQNLYGEGTVLIEGAYECLEELCNRKKEVYIVSSCLLHPYEKRSARLFADKFNFIVAKFPFLDPYHIIFAADKSKMVFDRYTDDRKDHLTGNIYHKDRYLYTAYHNKTETLQDLAYSKVTRLNDFKEVFKCFTGTYTVPEKRAHIEELLAVYGYEERLQEIICKPKKVEIELKSSLERDSVKAINHLIESIQRTIGETSPIEIKGIAK